MPDTPRDTNRVSREISGTLFLQDLYRLGDYNCDVNLDFKIEALRMGLQVALLYLSLEMKGQFGALPNSELSINIRILCRD